MFEALPVEEGAACAIFRETAVMENSDTGVFIALCCGKQQTENTVFNWLYHASKT